MNTLQFLTAITDLAFHTWFFTTGFLLSACVLSHSVRYFRYCKEACKNRQIYEQIDFLMSANYQSLYRHARQLNLTTHRLKKLELCQLIATYQLT